MNGAVAETNLDVPADFVHILRLLLLVGVNEYLIAIQHNIGCRARRTCLLIGASLELLLHNLFDHRMALILGSLRISGGSDAFR